MAADAPSGAGGGGGGNGSPRGGTGTGNVAQEPDGVDLGPTDDGDGSDGLEPDRDGGSYENPDDHGGGGGPTGGGGGDDPDGTDLDEVMDTLKNGGEEARQQMMEEHPELAAKAMGRIADDGTPGWRQGLEYGGTAGAMISGGTLAASLFTSMSPVGPIAPIGLGAAGAAIGLADDKFDISGAVSQRVGSMGDGQVGEGLSKVRDAGRAAIDQDESEYGKLAGVGSLTGRAAGLMAGVTIKGADPWKTSDAGGKIGKGVLGGMGGTTTTFREEGGTEGLQDVGSGLQTATANVASDKLDTAESGWRGVTERLPDSVTEKTDYLGQVDKQEVSTDDDTTGDKTDDKHQNYFDGTDNQDEPPADTNGESSEEDEHNTSTE